MSAVAQTSAVPSVHHLLDMNRSGSSKWIDDEYYRAGVLRLSAQVTETDIDHRLKAEADGLGVSQLQIVADLDVQTVAATLSASMITEPLKRGSTLSVITSPEFDSTTELYPAVTSAQRTQVTPSSSTTPSMLIDMEKKSKSGFRNGFRKMAGLTRRRKTLYQSSPDLSSSGSRSRTDISNTRSLHDQDCSSIDFDLSNATSDCLALKSPSLRSNKSSSVWSNKMSATTKSSYEPTDTLVDHDALQRTMECPELINLRAKQNDERQRFLDYRAQILTSIRAERDQKKSEKRQLLTRMVEEQMRKNDAAVEDLESRQLEDELKMVQDHENEKRSILARLRHMEAYCQNPSPPPTPMEFNFSGSDGTSSPTSVARGSIDSSTCTMVFPERKVTDKDYHNLASCYRERDAMDNLHASKINVLRGKQKRAVENFITRKENEVDNLEAQKAAELDDIDRDASVNEAECHAEFWEKRQVLEKRWKLQTLVEKAKVEAKTGLKHEILPPIVLVENEAADGYGVAR